MVGQIHVGQTNAEQLRCMVPQHLPLGPVDAPIDVAAFHADIDAEIRVRRHPDGEHVFGMLVMARRVPGREPIALFASLTPAELDVLSEQAWRAAQTIRERNAAAIQNDAPLNIEQGE